MDFSTSERALSSLLRRQPAITNPEILSLTEELLTSLKNRTTTTDGGDKDTITTTDNDEYESKILSLIQKGQSDRWEALAVGLHLSIEHLQSFIPPSSSHLYPEGPRVPSLTASDAPPPTTTATITSSFPSHIMPILLAELEHPEPRVRTLVAKTIDAHSRLSSSPTHAAERGRLFEVITLSLYDHLATGRGGTENGVQKTKDETKAVDDTTGWRALETGLQALAAYLGGCHFEEEMAFSHGTEKEEAVAVAYLARGLLPGTDETCGSRRITDLLEAVQQCCTSHVNRHVRAAGLAALESLLTALPSSSATAPLSAGVQLVSCAPLLPLLLSVLEITLADNWSQVRMAASVLCRTTFLVAGEARKRLFYPRLLPRMCLNRFYLAQGVKLYSQETWRVVLGEEGMKEVAMNAGGVVRYYVKMCDADNHVVREAACQAVAELSQKLGTHPDYASFLEPYVPSLLQALLMCFYDESWPVRDEACLACGTFVKAYPRASLSELPQLYELWVTHLTDQIWSVRRDAAAALADAAVAYGEDIVPRILNDVERLLPCAQTQPAMSREEYDARQNDLKVHTGAQLYSCGSLAPKLKSGRHAGGCSDCVVTRDKQPWEASDGCIYLVTELIAAGVLNQVELKGQLLAKMAEVCRVNHFPQGDDLRETLWKNLPRIAQSCGKKEFKRLYLDYFTPLLIENIQSRTASRLSVHAAKVCAVELGGLVGEGIMKGRLEMTGRCYEDIDDVWRGCVMEVKMSGGSKDEGFGPFGPPGPQAAPMLGRFP